MINTPNISELILEGKTSDIEKAIGRASEYYGMQTFNQALSELVKKNMITEESAYTSSSSPDDLKLMMRGVTRSGTTESSVVHKDETLEEPSKEEGKADAPGSMNVADEKQSATESEDGEKKIKITRGFDF